MLPYCYNQGPELAHNIQKGPMIYMTGRVLQTFTIVVERDMRPGGGHPMEENGHWRTEAVLRRWRWAEVGDKGWG